MKLRLKERDVLDLYSRLGHSEAAIGKEVWRATPRPTLGPNSVGLTLVKAGVF